METLAAALASVASTVGTGTAELFGASLGRGGELCRVSTGLGVPAGPLRGLGQGVRSGERRDPGDVLGLISEHWGLGSEVLTDMFAPGADVATPAAFTRYQREAASPETARGMLAAAHGLDITDQLARIKAPTLVVHRDRDRAAPLDQARTLAGATPGARLDVLAGRDHVPYIGDVVGLATSIRRFLGLPPPRRGSAAALTARQQQVA